MARSHLGTFDNQREWQDKRNKRNLEGMHFPELSGKLGSLLDCLMASIHVEKSPDFTISIPANRRTYSF